MKVYNREFLFNEIKHIKESSNIRYSSLVLLAKNRESFNKIIVIETSYLDLISASITQRIHSLIYDIKEIKRCNYCNNPLLFTGYYHKTCGNKECKIKSKNDSFKNTCKKKYGEDHFLKNNDAKNKFKQKCFEKTGYYHNWSNPKVRETYKNTTLNLYGVESPLQSNEIKQKALDTHMRLYNGVGLASSIIKEKTKQTNLKKYNVKNVSQFKDIGKRSGKTKSLNALNIKKKISNDFLNINIIIEYNMKSYTVSCNSCNSIFDILVGPFNRCIKFKTSPCRKGNPPIFKKCSIAEKELLNFIKDNVKSNEYVYENKKVLKNFKYNELDAYLPDYKLAFEFNGVYWHNELFKGNNYHLNKTFECNKTGITLIHIFEDNWVFKQDIIKSRILNLLNKTPNRIYSRKCGVREVSFKESNQFLEDNHLQGKCVSKYNIGLYNREELVSLMTFGKLRKSLGSKNKIDEYELLRFCNKLNTSVVGAASKLFKYFIETYNPYKIISYADQGWTNYKDDNLYIKLGFRYASTSGPNYWYVIDGVRRHRFNFRKDVLVREGYDKNMTGHEIMLSRNIYRVYDCGNYKFEWKNEN